MSAKRNGKAALASVQSENGHAHTRTVPEPPVGLNASGLALWDATWRLPHITGSDFAMIEKLARLEDEAASLRAIVAEDGAVLRKPMQNSRGQVIGEESYPHPGIGALRKIGTEASAACAHLGLTPEGRRKLGLDVLTAPAEPDALDRIRETRRKRLAAVGLVPESEREREQ
jgi:hypothetical protein